MTFYSYGADEYELGGIKISGEDILDSALAEQELLLGEMGLSSEAYHITSMDWDGESFMDETGQVCRRASARGERLLRDYEAVYRGLVQVVEPVSYEVSAVYEPAELGNISNSEKEQEEAFYQQAYEGFMKAMSTEMFPMCGMDQCTVDYLLAAMAYHFKKYDVASKCISRIQATPSASKKMKDRAYDLKEKIVAEIKNSK